MALFGRGRECGLIDDLLADARGGRGGGLLVHGAPGIGKSALLDYATESAHEFQIVRAAGVESEMELAFSGLQQLCAPLLESLPTLPTPQRDALGTAFGLHGGTPQDPLFVGLGALSLMSNAGSEAPLLCLVDDVQWLDRASARALGVLARRLDADSIALVLAGRESPVSNELNGVNELHLEGLTEADARVLLRTVLPGRIDEQVIERIIVETDGNPLALIELPRGLSPRELAGGFGLLEKLGLSGRIEESFRRRVEELPPETRALLLVAAIESSGDAALLWRICESLGIEFTAASAAETEELIRIDKRVRFFHPLVRSAVFAGATVEDRRRSHAALAEAMDSTSDADRRAWHRAEAAAGPDEEIAAELERSADRARTRGGETAAAAFLERAVELTLEPVARARRALAAAQAMQAWGAGDAALDMLATAEAGALDAHQRGQATLLRAQALAARSDWADGGPDLVKAAELLEPFDQRAASEAYLDALFTLANQPNLEVAQLLARLPLSDPPTPRQLLVRGYAVLRSKGFPHGVESINAAIAGYCAAEPGGDENEIELGMAALAAKGAWDARAHRLLTARSLEVARRSGLPLHIERALYHVAGATSDWGRADEVESAVDEAVALREALGLPPGGEDHGVIPALRGQEAETLRRTAEILDRIDPSAPDDLRLSLSDMNLALLYNGLADFQKAFVAARRGCDRHPAGGTGVCLAELVEAGARVGEREVATAALEKLSFRAQLGGNDWGLGVEARCRALLSEDDKAEALYLEAIERLESAGIPLPLARAYLVSGEWLRRRRRNRDAREHLRRACEIAEELGAAGFAQRAKDELAATGLRSQGRRLPDRDALTPQEARIAKLASEGLSNSEIGQRLYISTNTVDYHLKKVFRKLGVRSRAQLHRADALRTT